MQMLCTVIKGYFQLLICVLSNLLQLKFESHHHRTDIVHCHKTCLPSLHCNLKFISVMMTLYLFSDSYSKKISLGSLFKNKVFKISCFIPNRQVKFREDLEFRTRKIYSYQRTEVQIHRNQ